MAIIQFKVVYVDGAEKNVRVSPRAQTMTEEKFSGFNQNDAYTMRSLYYLAWASLSRAGMEPDDYETWLDKIVDVEDITPEIENPTDGAAPPPAPSSL